ncbi:hypothetical protein LCGC14_0717840 [marine sediment metagenome]|uniref:Uncharacterized protein n=1 Tax=marine sediment metagenome TaxID=412755 RepID=A0A0F9QD99_9ZZZZ
MIDGHMTFDADESIRTVRFIDEDGKWKTIYQTGSRSFDGRFHVTGQLPELSDEGARYGGHKETIRRDSDRTS